MVEYGTYSVNHTMLTSADVVQYKYIFDVDGTLTPSRVTIRDEMKEYFLSFANKNKCYLVTGGDREATMRQVGEEIYNACRMVFNCCGNDVYEGELNVFKNPWTLSHEARMYLKDVLRLSNYKQQTGVGGETGVDIFERGKHKGQILEYFEDFDSIRFFGDRTDVQGNDYPIASRLNSYNVYSVKDDLHTLELLKNLR